MTKKSSEIWAVEKTYFDIFGEKSDEKVSLPNFFLTV